MGAALIKMALSTFYYEYKLYEWLNGLITENEDRNSDSFKDILEMEYCFY